jgi:predicted nucleotidyltransferase
MEQISAEVGMQVQEQLDLIERDFNSTILFAIESGSRAWGFASPDSDYDVRFVYSPPLPYYFRVTDANRDMSLPENRDVIERPINGYLDINGWCAGKALGLIYKSNPTIFEWMNSPLVYRTDDSWMTPLRELAAKFYSPMRAHHHYYSTAKKNMQEHLQGEMVRYKKYLYVIRPLLCVKWIAAGKGIPPVNFMELVDGIVDDAAFKQEIKDLLEIKMRGGEAERQPTRPALNMYIRHMLNLYEKPNYVEGERADIGEMDEFLFWTGVNYQY